MESTVPIASGTDYFTCEAASITFFQLSEEEQFSILSKLLSLASARVLFKVEKNGLFLRNCRNFLPELPRNLSTKILNYLDIQNLVRCGLACRAWYYLVTNISFEQRAIKKIAPYLRTGLDLADANFVHKLYRRVCRALEFLTDISPLEFDGQIFPDVHLTFVNFCPVSDNFVASSAYMDLLHGGLREDILICPCIQQGNLLFSVKHLSQFAVEEGQMSCLTVHDRDVAVGYYSGFVLHCKLDGMIVERFEQHMGPVYAVDFDLSKDLLVSVGADHCAKVWRMSTQELLHTVHTFSYWVTEVKLLSTEAGIFIASGERADELSCTYLRLEIRKLNKDWRSSTSVWQETEYSVCTGIQVQGSCVYYLKQDLSLIICDLNNSVPCLSQCDNFTVDAMYQSAQLLAVGSVFLVCLLRTVNLADQQLCIVHRKGTLLNVLGLKALGPKHCICLGTRKWLDGFDAECLGGNTLLMCNERLPLRTPSGLLCIWPASVK